MKILFLIISIFLLSSPSWSERVDESELTLRDGLWYKKFTNTPFTGTSTGQAQGKVLNGKPEGEWFFYYYDGGLNAITNFKYGLREGKHEEYHENGKLRHKSNYKKENSMVFMKTILKMVS